VRVLRRQGLPAEMEQAGRSVKGQFKHADRIGARAVVIVGDGLEVKDMESGDQRPAADTDEVVRLVGA
jgi:histidyl-tRNA synthetase